MLGDSISLGCRMMDVRLEAGITVSSRKGLRTAGCGLRVGKRGVPSWGRLLWPEDSQRVDFCLRDLRLGVPVDSERASNFFSSEGSSPWIGGLETLRLSGDRGRFALEQPVGGWSKSWGKDCKGFGYAHCAACSGLCVWAWLGWLRWEQARSWAGIGLVLVLVFLEGRAALSFFAPPSRRSEGGTSKRADCGLSATLTRAVVVFGGSGSVDSRMLNAR